VRYYKVNLLSPATGNAVVFNDTTKSFVDAPAGGASFQSFVRPGVINPGALNLELDVVAYPFATFQGLSSVRIWGVGVSALGQAQNLSGYGIEIDAGMQAPYQLNAKAKSGQILAGTVFQGFGNWEGTNHYLELLVANAGILPSAVANIAFTWKAGKPLDEAITAAFNAAYPDLVVSSDIVFTVLDHDEVGNYNTLQGFAEYILEATRSNTYPGVQIRAQGDTIYVYDGSAAAAPIQIKFQDMIGQPTWIDAASITWACVMRADIGVGAEILFPAGLFPPYVLTTAQAALPNAPATNRLAFQGQFTVTEVHHYGNFRDSDAASWRTVYVGVPSGSNPLISGAPTVPQGLA
jgi:hypothetical protein